MLAQLAEKIENRGIEQGIERGVYKKAIADVVKMKEKKYPIADIVEITGLTLKEVQAL